MASAQRAPGAACREAARTGAPPEQPRRVGWDRRPGGAARRGLRRLRRSLAQRREEAPSCAATAGRPRLGCCLSAVRSGASAERRVRRRGDQGQLLLAAAGGWSCRSSARGDLLARPSASTSTTESARGSRRAARAVGRLKPARAPRSRARGRRRRRGSAEVGPRRQQGRRALAREETAGGDHGGLCRRLSAEAATARGRPPRCQFLDRARRGLRGMPEVSRLSTGSPERLSGRRPRARPRADLRRRATGSQARARRRSRRSPACRGSAGAARRRAPSRRRATRSACRRP